MSELDDFVRASQTRLGMAALLRAGAHALVVGLGAACAIVLIERGLSLGLGMAWAVAVPLGLSLLVAASLTVARWPSFPDAAIAVDARLKLDERVSSAIAPGKGPMAALVRRDAAERLSGRDAPTCFPLTVPASGRAAPFLLVALMVCLLVPQGDWVGWGKARAKRKADAETVQSAIETATSELRALGARAADDGTADAARTLSEYERRLLAMADESRRLVRREAREAAAELETRAATAGAAPQVRRLLSDAAETMGRLAARLVREPHGSPSPRNVATSLVRAQDVPASDVKAPEPRWLEAREVAVAAMSTDAIPHKRRAAVQRYFAVDPF